ncbi:hypothetical protein G6F57_021847 [Rhizopus arrhizus]|nr:hypothetical protein G6F57_021847 [Rhizopus arrhizus]
MAEETEDLAFAHPQRHIVDHVLIAEVLVQPVHVDNGGAGVRRGVVRRAHCRVASTGWPGCRRVAASGVGRASTM